MKKLNTLLFNQGGKCFYCNAVLNIEEASIDHVIPQSKGGTDNVDNLIVCCKYANQAFKDYSPKHKMAVIKQICSSPFFCQKVFPREKKAEQVPLSQTKEKNPKISVAYKLLSQVIKSIESEGKEVIISQLKTKMLKVMPSFKESDYGFNQFKKFLLQAQQDEIIALKKTSGNNYIIKQPKK